MNKNKTLALILVPFIYCVYYNLLVLIQYRSIAGEGIAFPLEKLVTLIAAVLIFPLMMLTRMELIRKFIGSYLLFYAIFALYTFLARFQVHMNVFTNPELESLLLNEISFILLIPVYAVSGGFFLRHPDLIEYSKN